MPATIQKILKPSKYRAVDTSGNNNHGQIYSGRGLEFDGAVDYLTGPTVAQGFTDLSYTKNFTVACWLKIDSLEDAGVWAMGQNDNDRVGLTIGADGEIAFTAWDSSDYTHASGGAEGSKAIEVNTWYRVICTMSPTNTKKLYINGVLQTGTSQAFGSPLSSINTQLYIGRTGLSATGYLGMKMSDFQVWNSTWTQSDVTFDYLNPESLALSNGGTSLTESNLKLWYPMQDGHRGQKSYIMDGAGTGLGDELISDISASAWTKGFATDGGSVDASTTITDNSDGSVTFETAEASDWQTVAIPFVNENGVTYKISITGEALAETDGDNDDKFYWRIGSSVNNGHNTENINTSWMISEGAHTETNYFSSNVSTGTAYFIGMFKKASNTVHKFRLDSVSIKAVNQKHHATTAFLGDDLFDTGVGDYSDSTGGWTADGNNTVDNNDSALRITFVDDSDGARLDLNDAEDLTTDLTVGRTYRLSFEYKINQVTGSNVGLQINTGTGSFVTSSALTDTSFSGTPVTKDFVATHATNAEVKFSNMDSGDILHLKNFTLKEVGVASGWTDADQQLDVAQTALQSYNQLAWFDGTGDYIDINPSGTIWNTTDGTFNSISCCVHHASEETVANSSQVMYFGTENGSPNFYILEKDSDEYHVGYNTGNGEVFGVDLKKDFIHDKWHHWVMNVKMNSNPNDTAISSSDVELFLNGEKLSLSYVQPDTNPSSNGMDIPADGDINLFGSGSGTAYNPTGSITEVAVFNDQLTTAEVQELYNDGKILDAREHSLFATKCSGYWKNNGLAQWTDYSGNDNHGTVKNVTETILLPAGVDASRDTQGFLMNRQKTTNSLNLKTSEGLAVVSDNNPDAVIIQDSESFDHSDGSNSKLSISAWFKANSYGSLPQDQIIVSKGTNDSGKREWKLLLNDSSTTELRFEGSNSTNGGNGNNLGYTLANITDTNWHHIVVTYDGTAIAGNEVVAYFDGGSAIELTDGDAEAKINAEDGNVCIGDILLTNAGGDGFEFAGQIDDVCYYNRKILSATEAKRNYNAGKRSHR